MTRNSREWRWAGEDGVQKTVTEQELIAELSSETLPAVTLVWRKGWLEWLPAMQVAELAWALPAGRGDNPVTPKERSTAEQPPPPPLYRYPVLKRRAAALKSGGGDDIQKPAAPLEQRAAIEPPTEVRPAPPLDPADRGPGTVPAAAKVDEPPANLDNVEDEDLDDIEASSPIATAPLDGDDSDEGSARPSGSAVYVPPHAPPTSERPLPNFDDDDLPPIPASPSPPADLTKYADEASRTVKKSRRKTSRYLLYGGLSALTVVGIAVGLRAFGTRPSRTSSPEVSSAVASGAKREAPGTACRVTANPVKLADAADPGVQLLFAPVPGTARVAVGFAQSEAKAIGMTIDPRTLDRDQVFREAKPGKVASVVPTTSAGKLHFKVTREASKIVLGRAVNASQPFSIATSTEGVVRVGAGKETELLWPLAKEDLTIPRVASSASAHAVALRIGGKSGRILVGWLDPAGRKQTELRPVERPEEFVGMPSLAASENAALVAFAVRGAHDAAWSVALATAQQGAIPTSASRFQIPEGGPGGEAISPSVAPLSGGRWLVTWTEGASGNRAVRAEVLDPDLHPLSAPVTVSPTGSNAGQGAVWGDGASAAVLFYVQKGDDHELWGTALECMR